MLKTLYKILTFDNKGKFVIEQRNDQIKSDAWKSYLDRYDKKDEVFNDIFNIVAEDRKDSKDKVITLERFISWYINCC